MHKNLYGDKDLGWRSGEGLMSGSVKESQVYFVRFRDNVEEKDGMSPCACTVLSLFNKLPSVSGSRYFKGGRTLPILLDPIMSQADVSFVPKLFPECSLAWTDGM